MTKTINPVNESRINYSRARRRRTIVLVSRRGFGRRGSGRRTGVDYTGYRVCGCRLKPDPSVFTRDFTAAPHYIYITREYTCTITLLRGTLSKD